MTGTMTYEDPDHGRYEVPMDYLESMATTAMLLRSADEMREEAEDMSDGANDLSDATPVALLVILASLRYERELGAYVPEDSRYIPEFGPQS